MPFTTYASSDLLARAAAELFVNLAHESIAARGRFVVALSGGSTPKAMNGYLTQAALEWNKIHCFWSDDRCVPPDQADSNYRMAHETLLQHIAIPAENIHRVQGELPPDTAAEDYERELKTFFQVKSPSPSGGRDREGGDTPTFDLLLLGMGDDGHTASIFPNTSAITETTRWVIAQEHNFPPPPLVPRITFTVPLINAARNVAFLVAGASKAERLKQVLHGPRQPHLLPSQLVQPSSGILHWLVDQAAAAQL